MEQELVCVPEESQEQADGETFLELHLHQEPIGSVEDLETDNAQVILIFQDVLTCGICNKQYVELSDFLVHKAKHTISIGNAKYFKCEICKSVVNSTEDLLKHYEMRHQVPLTSDEDTFLPSGDIQSDICENSINNEESQQGVENGHVDNLESPVTPLEEEDGLAEEEAIQPDQEPHPQTRPKPRSSSSLARQRILSNHRLTLKSYRQQIKQLEAAKCKEGYQSTNNNNIRKDGQTDFTFVLLTETVKGSTFTYGRTWFKCLHCKFKTAGKLCMIRHMKDKHSDVLDLHQNLEVKEDCGQDEHHKVMRMSTYEASYLREKRFRRRQTRRPVLESRDIVGRFACDKCNKVFTRQRYLRKHVEIHRTEKKFLCDVCNKSFKSQTYLTVHKKVHKVKMFKCNQCDFTSNVNAAIHAHRQVHSQGSVLCDICGYAYTDKATLTKHKRVHDVTRPYACTFQGCTWRFKTEIMCRAHYRAHTSEGQFKCSHCGYAFRQKHHLQRHETKIHGIIHTKSRSCHPVSTKIIDNSDANDITDTVHLVVNAGDNDLHFENGLVVSAPITLEADLSSLNVAYQTLLQTDKNGVDSQAILLSQQDSHIVFQQE